LDALNREKSLCEDEQKIGVKKGGEWKERNREEEEVGDSEKRSKRGRIGLRKEKLAVKEEKFSDCKIYILLSSSLSSSA
jgi:hypothetical protein